VPDGHNQREHLDNDLRKRSTPTPHTAASSAHPRGRYPAISVVGVAEDLLVQRRVADGVRGRVYAARIAAVQASVAAPLLFAGALGAQAAFGLAAALMAAGVTTLTVLVARADISGEGLPAGDRD
jgi:hypothetical protein